MVAPTTTGESLKVKEKRRFNPRLLLVPVLIAVSGYGVWRYLNPPVPSNILTVSGRIEADETDVGAKTGGRVAEILVREGDEVKSGQVIAVIEDEEVNQQLQAAIAQVQSARQEESQARLDINVADNRIQEAEANLAQAKEDSQGRVSQARSTISVNEAQVAEAEAQLVQARADVKRTQSLLKQAQADYRRFADLGAQGVISRQQLEQYRTASETAAANLEAARAVFTARTAAVNTARQQLEAARGSLIQTQATALNPAIRNSQLLAYQQQKQQAAARLAAAQARVRGAIADQQQLQKRLDSFKVKSPIDGIVQDRPLEPGSVVTGGKTLLTLIDPRAIYMRAYVPEGDMGKIYVGKPARVFLDSDPKRPLPARISAIDPKASFTPENIYFKQDRVRQVFGVKLTIDQERSYAKPGMPADAEIDLK